MHIKLQGKTCKSIMTRDGMRGFYGKDTIKNKSLELHLWFLKMKKMILDPSTSKGVWVSSEIMHKSSALFPSNMPEPYDTLPSVIMISPTIEIWEKLGRSSEASIPDDFEIWESSKWSLCNHSANCRALHKCKVYHFGKHQALTDLRKFYLTS